MVHTEDGSIVERNSWVGILRTDRADAMTIPDIGHCAGSGSPPVPGSERDEGGAKSGVCPACSGRFELHHTGDVSLHDAAEIDDREAWPESSCRDEGTESLGRRSPARSLARARILRAALTKAGIPLASPAVARNAPYRPDRNGRGRRVGDVRAGEGGPRAGLSTTER